MTTAADAFRALRAELVSAFPERQNVIDGALCAVLSGEHVLLLGPPGTAKSALVRAVASAFGCTYFERLLTKFSTPEELFGPVSLRALEADRFERVTSGKLPEAEVGFLDEVFLANSAILNSLLTIMNERLYHNDGKAVSCPLISLFGASNDLPEGKELEAVYDRFLLRFDVQYLAQLPSIRNVLLAEDPVSSVRISKENLLQAQRGVQDVHVTEATVEGLLSIRTACQAEGIVCSDRRWKKGLKLVRASAFLMGATETQTEDLAVFTDILWREPKERQKVARIVGQKADPASTEAQEILEAARETARGVTALRAGEKSTYVGASVKAIDLFCEQKQKLSEMHRQASRRSKTTIADAIAEVQGLHAEAQRVAQESLGLGRSVMEVVRQAVLP